MTTGSNWAGNYHYRASTLLHPVSVEEARSIVASSPRIHGLGTRHCFNDIADSVAMISLDQIDPDIQVDAEAMTATVGASLRYGPFAKELHRRGFALHNMASLPHISIGGATATATHGSGTANGNLSSAVSGIEMITSDGELLRVRRGDPDFAGMVVHLGGLGLVTRLTFDVQPTYNIRQEVLEDLPWEPLIDDFKSVMSCGYSVSVFTQFREEKAGLLWRKHRPSDGWDRESIPDWGARRASVNRHPIDGYDGSICTPQLLQPGPWCDLLPYFPIDAVPSAGVEIQTEYMIDIDHAADALNTLRAFEPRLRDVLMVSEIRAIAADDLWLSTAYKRDTAAIHFTWHRDQARIDALLPDLEAALAPFEPRAHWGKVFALSADVLRERYRRYDDYRVLRRRLDPRGAFVNSFVERTGLV